MAQEQQNGRPAARLVAQNVVIEFESDRDDGSGYPIGEYHGDEVRPGTVCWQNILFDQPYHVNLFERRDRNGELYLYAFPTEEQATKLGKDWVIGTARKLLTFRWNRQEGKSGVIAFDPDTGMAVFPARDTLVEVGREAWYLMRQNEGSLTALAKPEETPRWRAGYTWHERPVQRKTELDTTNERWVKHMDGTVSVVWRRGNSKDLEHSGVFADPAKGTGFVTGLPILPDAHHPEVTLAIGVPVHCSVVRHDKDGRSRAILTPLESPEAMSRRVEELGGELVLLKRESGGRVFIKSLLTVDKAAEPTPAAPAPAPTPKPAPVTVTLTTPAAPAQPKGRAAKREAARQAAKAAAAEARVDEAIEASHDAGPVTE